MSTLNDLYSRLDDIIIHEMPSLYKVETIGQCHQLHRLFRPASFVDKQRQLLTHSCP